jgi:hypothetical protein
MPFLIDVSEEAAVSSCERSLQEGAVYGRHESDFCFRSPTVGLVEQAMDWTTEESGLDSRQKQDIFLTSRPALGPTQPLLQFWRGLFTWVKTAEA